MIGYDLNYEGHEGGLKIPERMKWSEALLEACRLFMGPLNSIKKWSQKLFSVPESIFVHIVSAPEIKIPGL